MRVRVDTDLEQSHEPRHVREAAACTKALEASGVHIKAKHPPTSKRMTALLPVGDRTERADTPLAVGPRDAVRRTPRQALHDVRSQHSGRLWGEPSQAGGQCMVGAAGADSE